MRLYSTNSPDLRVDFGEAVLRSLPADNGLYMPEHIPQLDGDFWSEWKDMSYQDMACCVVSTLLQGAIPEGVLDGVIADSLDFAAPVVVLDEHHRKRGPAGPHLERAAPSPLAQIAAVLEILVADAGLVEKLLNKGRQLNENV